MRAIFVGASSVTVMAARQLLKTGHDVVIIEQDEKRIAELEEELDCGFVHGNGSRPAVLEELSPGENDVLFCLSSDDQDNIIASLVGQTMSFSRIVTKIEDPDFQGICTKLGLDDVIVPDRDVGERLADMVEGHDVAQLSAAVEGGIRFFHYIARKASAGKTTALDLPGDSRVIAITRDGESRIVAEEDDIREGDKVLLITHKRHLHDLKKRLSDTPSD
jgi:trk system potassium uptake protein TrkA